MLSFGRKLEDLAIEAATVFAESCGLEFREYVGQAYLVLDKLDRYRAISQASLNDKIRRQNLIKKIVDELRAEELGTEVQYDVSTTPEYCLESAVAGFDIQKKLIQRLITLAPREERIIRLRYGLGPSGEPTELSSIASDFGVSIPRVMQIEVEVLHKLKQPKRTGFLKDSYWKQPIIEKADQQAKAMIGSGKLGSHSDQNFKAALPHNPVHPGFENRSLSEIPRLMYAAETIVAAFPHMEISFCHSYLNDLSDAYFVEAAYKEHRTGTAEHPPLLTDVPLPFRQILPLIRENLREHLARFDTAISAAFYAAMRRDPPQPLNLRKLRNRDKLYKVRDTLKLNSNDLACERA